ncbi:MAG: hypothetical protein JWN53_1880 [Gemmatimonadetes bacterium]|nr:hypothetical protein [Gemmatimonadota bacterium]
MYAGHAAIALAIRSRAPSVPAPLLVAACFGPDWLELLIGIARGRSAGEVYSHFIPAVVGGALVAAGLYALHDRRGAGWILLGWLSHWPADFLTAHKPLFAAQPLVGLDLYDLPAADFALEGTMVVLACLLYARAYAPDPPRRRWVRGLAAVLLFMQGMLDFGISHTPNHQWHPSLGHWTWRPRPTVVLSVQGPTALRMPLASSPYTFTVSEQWRRAERKVSSRWSV